ncbi:MAG: ACP S-malonyltransferase [Candidatus Omnitrophota bacterium]
MVESAFIFPGQGAQYIGMGREIYEKYKTARDIFEEANSCLDFDLIKVCFEGPMEVLSRTDISQPAILAVSIASLRVFQENNPDVLPFASAGLSLGEYSALVCSGSLKFKDAVKLVRKRGLYMEEASRRNQGKMLSIIGLERDKVEEICRECRTEIANLNCPGQIVVSGSNENIEQAAKVAKEKKAKMAVILDVSGPFHSSFMKEAAVSLEKELKDVEISVPSISVVSNVTAAYESRPDEIRENLIKQVYVTVNWQDSMGCLIKDGIMNFFEIGPGKVLKGLMRRINSSVSVINIETVEDIEKVSGKI